ncbi:MAG: hypothetical protein FWF32_03770 [Endomicrobia bacterium]|nr:hypothetical protein [Endomicrobiia bacterium]
MDSGRLDLILSENQGGCFIIDCSAANNVRELAERIDSYNKNVPEELGIKEVLFYNSDIKDYLLSDENYNFETSFIFDFSKFIEEQKHKEKISGFFTNVPAVYAGKDQLSLNYGSRLDNLTLHYLFLLSQRALVSNETHHHNASDKQNIPYISMETAVQYMNLYEELILNLENYDLYDDTRKSFYDIVMKNAFKNLESLNGFINGKPVNKEKLNNIIEEYRTLLNFLFYFEFSDRKDRNDIVSETEIDNLAGRLNDFMVKSKDSKGKAYSQTTILSASGMSAIKTIAAMLISGNVSKIAFGDSLYYENARMLKGMFENPETFGEEETEKIINLDSDAVFLDLISNSAELPLADIKGIVSGLAKKDYKKPFYLCIDNSMYPAFQVADIFNGIDLPDNFNIIIYGSMQKMHQRGLEITTSGFLTLMSNGRNHEKVLNQLKNASKATSSDIDAFKYTVLKEFIENNNITHHSEELNNNAAALASELKSISSVFGNTFDIVHPSLYPAEQKRIWEENGSPGIPFVFIRNTGNREIFYFTQPLHLELTRQNFAPMSRDSYGFVPCTTINYDMSTVRVSPGIDSVDRFVKMIDIFSETAFDYFISEILIYDSENKITDLMYDYVKSSNRSKKADELVYKYISSLKPKRALSDESVLNISIICGELGKPVPENIRLRAENILNDNKVSGNLTEEARKFSLDASVFGNKYAKSAPFWEWIYMIPGISFVADSKLFSKVLSETFFKNKSKQEINYTLKTSTAVKVIDIVGSIVLAVSVLSGVGIAGLAAFIFSRAIIFSMAHKGFDWKKHWKERLMLTGLFSAFTAFPLIALQLLSLSAVLFIPFIIFGNIALHSVYNNLPFKLKASIVEKSSEEKQIYIANIIKNKLSERLNISKEKIIINTDYEVKYGFVRTLSEAFYSDVNLSVKENDLIALNVPKSFLLAIYETYDSKRDEYIETFVENISVLYEVKQTVPEDKRDEAIISVLNGFNDRVADFARIASLKSSLFAAVTVPSFDEIMKISEDVQKSSFQWSGVNKDLLYVISIMQRLSKDLDDKAKQIILFQCMEFFGYILQSQTWLSPAHYDGQYGFMQDGSMASSYERERAHTSDLDPVFKSIFSNHSKTQIIKTKEAALFEYIIEKGNEKGSSLILPDSIVSDFKNIEIAFLEDKRYSSYLLDENEIDSLLKQQTSRSITDRYFIIDCSDTDNIETVAEKIEEYNKNVQERLKIKEVLFYNADLKDYVLSDKKLSFMTSYIFDFSKFIDERENRTALSGLFTNVPAVYVANHDGFVLDYGSRLDNFTLHYLYLLMDRQSIVHVPNVISADRRDIASPRAETIQEYKDLYDKLSNSLKKYNFFDGAKKIFYTTVMQNISENIKSLNDYINGKPVDTKKFNDIVDEYRTLLNFLFYFQWSDRKDIGNIISDSERDKLAERFNEFITKPKNSSGVPFSQNTVLATSGMSAAKTAVLMFMSENISKIAYGKNIYYENAYMFEGLNAFVDIDKFEEENTEEILAINTEAVFFDLISNASSIPLADIKRIISEFAKKKYQTPFYVCIDNSMYPAFQFADIFDGIDLPDNMYVIVYGSMQKMHQRGLEIVTSGFLTLMSNGYNHEQVLNRLKDASKFTSSEIDTFRHIALSEFVDSNEFLQRSKALNDNAEKTALALNDIARIFGDALSVFHPSLYSGDQKRIWEENSSAGIPFFFIKSVEKSEGRHMDAFLEFLFKKMLAETPFSPIVRDSYGFDSFTNVTYGFGDRAVRFNVGLDVERDMDKFLDVFAESAYEYYMNNKYTNISANEMIEKMYVYVTERRGGKKADELVYKYISSLNSNLVLPYADIVKIVTICNELGKPLPEVIKLNAEDILKDKKHDFHPRFFAFMLLKSENNSYALPEDMLSGLEKYTAAFDGLKIADKVNKKEFSNIDLQIMCGAVYAHMSSKYPELVKFTDEKGIYKAILNNAKIIENSGVFDASLSMGDKILKDSNIMRYIQENIIHEITHKYLLSAGISLGENQENAITFHEFYSELSALIFAKSVSEKEFDSFYANFIKDTSDEKYKNELHHLKARKQIIEILSAFNDSEISITDKRFISALEANMNAANSKKDLKEVVLAILSSMGKVNFSGNNLRNTEIIPGKEIAGMVKLFSESKEINKNYRINGNVIDAVYDSGSDMYEDFSSALDKFLETGVQTNILSPEQLIKAFVLSHRLNVKVNNAGFLNAVNKLIEISEINAGNLDAAPVYIDALKYISDKSLESIYLVRNDLLSIMEFYRGNGNPQQQAAASRSMLEMLDPLYQGTGDFVKDGIPATQNKDSIYKILSAA